jgi:hypothetical protein
VPETRIVLSKWGLPGAAPDLKEYSLMFGWAFDGGKILFDKLMAFAENGNGRRLLNTLSRGMEGLSPAMLDEVLKTYCETGLTKEVESLKKRRGILKDSQYDALAQAVRDNCSHETVTFFQAALRNLLVSGIKMNPAKMEP